MIFIELYIYAYILPVLYTENTIYFKMTPSGKTTYSETLNEKKLKIISLRFVVYFFFLNILFILVLEHQVYKLTCFEVAVYT